MEVVIARYNENIEWVYKLELDYKIYNKGEDITPPNIKIDNIAREGYTYLTHIIENYEKLADYSVFLQGNPFDHSINLFDDITKFLNNKKDFYYLTDRILKCNLSGCVHHPGLPLKSVYQEIFNKNDDDLFHFYFGAGAQFIVSKNNILKHPKNFYEKIRKIVERDNINEYVLERFWGLIFGFKIE